jgi:tripartite-type tricarboxylate transporter receptor subunit TctC
VVENIPGAGSNVATDRVAQSAADGYTLLMGGNSSLAIFAKVAIGGSPDMTRAASREWHF